VRIHDTDDGTLLSWVNTLWPMPNEKAHLPEPGEKVERKGDKQNE
jgi:hypothetical protein